MTWTIETVREAPVAPDDVFQLYADPSTWSTWGHAARWARIDGPLVEGAIVDVKADYGRIYHCLISQLVAGRALVLEVRPPLMTVIQTYVVEPSPGGSRIRHALQISGPLAGPTRLIGLRRAYQRRLDKEVAKVIDKAERQEPATAPLPT
jgi:uncharacterized protein YndB with AHSA1/START domain